jgi:alkylation response protein AidB-like acyl-CoA dehydrogenase
MFISGAGATDMLVVMARTGSATSGAKGISAFAVPADTAGIHYGKNETKMGWNSQPTRAITFEDTRIPAYCLLGEEGEGFKIAMKGLDEGPGRWAHQYRCLLFGRGTGNCRPCSALYAGATSVWQAPGSLSSPAVQAG